MRSIRFLFILASASVFLGFAVVSQNREPSDVVPLEELVATSSAEIVRDVLSEQEASLLEDYEFSRGYGLAHAAIVNDEAPEVLRVLAEFGVSIDIQDEDGRTPLHHAIDAESEGAVRQLLHLGARRDLPNNANLNADDFCREALKTYRTPVCEYLLEN